MKNLVIIPTYNELDNIRPMIDKVFSLSEKFDLLVIDDGSPDGTASVVKEKQQEYPGQLHLIERQGKLGLGTAYLTGFQWALEHGYDYISRWTAISRTIPTTWCGCSMPPKRVPTW